MGTSPKRRLYVGGHTPERVKKKKRKRRPPISAYNKEDYTWQVLHSLYIVPSGTGYPDLSKLSDDS